MTKLNTKYFYNKDQKLLKEYNNQTIIWENSRKELNDLYPFYQQKIENSLINFLKLKNTKNYYIKYSLKNRIKLYYQDTPDIKDKELVLDLEFIYDKNLKKFVDFIITSPNFKLKSKTILNNFNIIYKIIKNLLKKDLLLKKYNFLNKQYTKNIRKQQEKVQKNIKRLCAPKGSIAEELFENRYNFLKTLLLKKEFFFKDKLEHIIFENFYPEVIGYPISLKVNFITSDLYELIIKCKPNKTCPQGFYSYKMGMSQLDNFLKDQNIPLYIDLK